MRLKKIQDRHPPAEITADERRWLTRVKRDESALQMAHYSLVEDGLASTPMSRAVRCVKLGRSTSSSSSLASATYPYPS